MRHLSIGERQRVEILKVLMGGARLVILDEPTSVLAPQEVDALFVGLDKLRAEGLSIVIITHKLHEARAIADRVTVLRGGRTSWRPSTPTSAQRRRAGRGDGRTHGAPRCQRTARPPRPAPCRPWS